MTTISEYKDDLPNRANEVLKQQLLQKLDPILKQKMLNSGGDLTVDLEKGIYEVTAGDDELEQQIMADLRDKKGA